jgi:hypothetical protein
MGLVTGCGALADHFRPGAPEGYFAAARERWISRLGDKITLRAGRGRERLVNVAQFD